MSGFSQDWLDLREAADARARSEDVANALAAWFTLRDHVTVVDLGAGTGANLRATAPLLPERQTWILVDHDDQLLAAARQRIADWSDSSVVTADGMRLERAGQTIDVQFRKHDLAQGLTPIVGEKTDLVTASALFDLTSHNFIRQCVQSVTAARAAFLTVLNYNGRQQWSPHRPLDNQVIAAFNRDQLRDKGFGPALGPTATVQLSDQLQMQDYSIIEGDSPWQLSRLADAQLLLELRKGTAEAATQAGLDTGLVERWLATEHTSVVIGHTDIFATAR